MKKMTSRERLIGQRIASARRLYKTSQVTLAEVLKIGRSTLDMKEKGVSSVTVRELIQVSEYYGLPLEFFINEKI